jgi:hypothetical protein
MTIKQVSGASVMIPSLYGITSSLKNIEEELAKFVSE